MTTWKLATLNGDLCCARCFAPLRGTEIVHKVNCRTSNGDYEVDLTINLKDQGLVHAEGSKCKCHGEHDLTVAIDLEAHELHADYQCEVPVLTAEAVQRLHEEAHPEGTAYAENCYEPACRDALQEAN